MWTESWKAAAGGEKEQERRQENTGRIVLLFVSYPGRQRHLVIIKPVPPKVLIHIGSLVTDVGGACVSFPS